MFELNLASSFCFQHLLCLSWIWTDRRCWLYYLMRKKTIECSGSGFEKINRDHFSRLIQTTICFNLDKHSNDIGIVPRKWSSQYHNSCCQYCYFFSLYHRPWIRNQEQAMVYFSGSRSKSFNLNVIFRSDWITFRIVCVSIANWIMQYLKRFSFELR